MREDYFGLITLKDLQVNDKLILLFLINEDKEQKTNNNIVALIDYIELMLSISKRTILRCMKRLKENGYITCNKLKYNHSKLNNVNVYHINYDLIKEKLGWNNIIQQEF